MPPTFSRVAFFVQATTFSSMDYSRIILIVLLSSPPAPNIAYSPHSSQDVFLKNEIREQHSDTPTALNKIPTPNHGLQDLCLSLHLLYFAPSSFQPIMFWTHLVHIQFRSFSLIVSSAWNPPCPISRHSLDLSLYSNVTSSERPFLT